MMKSGKTFPGAWDFLQIIKKQLPGIGAGTVVSIWQHPEGGEKQISTGVVRKAPLSADYISYEADTFGGTSGSLVTVAGKPRAIHVGVLKDKQGNFGLKLSTVLEVLQRTPRNKELTDHQAFTWANKPDEMCLPKMQHSINDDQIVEEPLPQRRPVLNKRRVRTKFFTFWQERIRWLAVLYILLIGSGLGFYSFLLYTKDERDCQKEYSMSCT